MRPATPPSQANLARERDGTPTDVSQSNHTGEVAGEVTGEVRKRLLVCRGTLSRRELQQQLQLQLQSEENFRRLYLIPALEAGYIERTIPNKPNSRLQKYRLTAKGAALLTDSPEAESSQ